MDDATVEAIWERHVSRRCPRMADHDPPLRVPVPCEDCYSVESFWRRIAYEPDGRTAAALPDPRPTEAAVRQTLMSQPVSVPYIDWVCTILRGEGCFRPEPAAAQNDSSITYAAEPVPAAEPPQPGVRTMCLLEAHDDSCAHLPHPGEPVPVPIEPVPVPMVTVRREKADRWPGEDRYEYDRVPADQIPEGWEPVDG